MTKQSAGILVYRKKEEQIEVLLVHPGGPLFAKKDDGFWGIPKGEFGDDEEAFAAAKREFSEETGHSIDGEFKPLASVTLKSGKKVYAWAIEGDIDVATLVSNTFDMEWPPHSGTMQAFPEVDRGEWFDIEIAKVKIYDGQLPFLDELVTLLKI